jgi:hypothetical protein
MNDENQDVDKKQARLEAWLRLRGALKDVYAEYGGGEAYLRKIREEFNESMEERINLIAESDIVKRNEICRFKEIKKDVQNSSPFE